MALIRYFAAAEEAAGRAQEVRSDATLGDLRSALTTERPGLSGILPKCAVLVDGSRVDDDTVLTEDAVIDILPPFAGG